jgi:hypothetical protein
MSPRALGAVDFLLSRRACSAGSNAGCCCVSVRLLHKAHSSSPSLPSPLAHMNHQRLHLVPNPTPIPTPTPTPTPIPTPTPTHARTQRRGGTEEGRDGSGKRWVVLVGVGGGVRRGGQACGAQAPPPNLPTTSIVSHNTYIRPPAPLCSNNTYIRHLHT